MDLKNGMVIKCNSEKEAQEFIKEAYKQGFKWINNVCGNGKTCWYTGCSKIYYYLESNQITWGTKDFDNDSIEYSTLKEKIKTMTKSDLKNGMVVELASGSRALVINGLLLFEDGYQGLSGYKDDLTTKIFNNEFQINKVFKSKLYNLCDVLTDGLSLIWEREETKLSNEDKQIIKKGIKKIQEECKNHKFCVGCIFDDNGACILDKIGTLEVDKLFED